MSILNFKDYTINEEISNFNFFEQDIMKNWEIYYDTSHGDEIPYNKFGVSTIMGEMWDDGCIAGYMDNNGIEYDNYYEDFEEYLWDAIDDVVSSEKWDGYIYIDPYESGELYGITIFYRFVKF